MCGTIRVPILQPALGDGVAQLLEMPVMLVAIWQSARYVVKRMQRSEASTKRQTGARLGKLQYFIMGLLALGWMLAAEVGLYLAVHWHEGKGLWNWVQDRDFVAGQVFFASLGLYAILPFLIS